jgi:hypothetical protein
VHNRANWWPTTCLAVSLAAYCVVLGAARAHAASKLLAVGGLPALGTKLPAPTGFVASFRRFPAPRRARCTLVHFSADGCEFCRMEAPLWRRAESRAAREGCNIAAIAPFSGGLTSAIPPLVFVPVAWAEVVPLRWTPTTLVLDRQNILVWDRFGALDAESLRSLEATLASMREKR